MLSKIKSFFKSLFNSSKPAPPNRSFKRKTIADVKVGEKITIEWSKMVGGIGKMTCLNNDIQNRKIYLQVRWVNYEEIKCEEYERIVLSYDDYKLKNFTLLNQQLVRAEGKQLSKSN